MGGKPAGREGDALSSEIMASSCRCCRCKAQLLSGTSNLTSQTAPKIRRGAVGKGSPGRSHLQSPPLGHHHGLRPPQAEQGECAGTELAAAGC